MKKAGIAPQQIQGYDRITVGHMAAARLVREGEVDCCISTRVVAQTMSLEFIPLAEKPYHLLIKRPHLELAPVQKLLETLGRASFRREVEANTGYNMRTAGERLV
jgi:putative molybdopterin biosynthesis protein